MFSRNTTIRSNLVVEPADKVVEEHCLRCFGHVIGMGNDRLVKMTYVVKVVGRRYRGRPHPTPAKEYGNASQREARNGVPFN